MKGKVKALLNKLSDRYEAKKGSGKKANDEFGYYKRGRGKLAKMKGFGRLNKKANSISAKRRGSKKCMLKEKMKNAE